MRGQKLHLSIVTDASFHKLFAISFRSQSTQKSVNVSLNELPFSNLTLSHWEQSASTIIALTKRRKKVDTILEEVRRNGGKKKHKTLNCAVNLRLILSAVVYLVSCIEAWTYHLKIAIKKSTVFFKCFCSKNKVNSLN